MAGSASGKRYAQALFAIATEQDILDRLRSDLDVIGEVAGHPTFGAVVDSPRVPFEAKEELIRRQFGTLHPIALNLALLLVTKGRLSLAPDVAREFSAMADEARGIAHAEVTTAVPLTEVEQQAISQRLSALTGKQILLQTRVDPSIIGGMVARIGDQLIDGSTRTRLSQLRRTLATAAG